MKKLIRVKDIGPGIFASERSVSIDAGADHYTLLVDQQYVRSDTLEVQVVAESAEDALIDLPAETFTSGNRIRVPRTALIPA